jgi:hypothetical protein
MSSVQQRKFSSSNIVGHNEAPQSETMGILMLPSTPKVFKLTKRELFGRRMSMMDRPLIVVNFQGVIGEFLKEKAG